MDFIRQQLNMIQERLAGLTASQKALVGALVVITIMTMLYWGRYASGKEMVALNSVPMSAEEIAAATSSLRAKGIGFTTSGSTIMVPADDQMSALSDLSFNQALPNSPNFFETMFEKVSPFGTASDHKARLNNARERTLSAMITGFPDVKTATVLVNDPQQGGIGRNEPRATVNIMTRSGAGVKKLSQSATMLMLNAVSGLKRDNISVIVDGQSFSNSGDSVAGAGNDALDIIRNFENGMAEKIRGNFIQFIPSIVVSVTAEVDTKTTRETINKVDPTNKVVLPTKSTSDVTTSNEPALSAEPGLTANAGIDANTGPAPMAGSNSEKTEESNTVDYGKSMTEILTPAGRAKIVGAAVRVPRSYFVGYWRAKNRKADGEPTDAEYATIMQSEISSIRGEVQKLTNIADAAQIAVTEFPDLDGLALLMNPQSSTSSSGGVTMIAGAYAKEGAIGILALASLFMVSRIVKKSVPAPTLALAGLGVGSLGGGGGSAGGSARNRGPSTLAGDEAIAGEVAEGGSVLMGQELDPTTLETAQMVEQVSGYVKDNPDAAAALVRRLMSHE